MLHETATNITEVTGETERQVGQFKTLTQQRRRHGRGQSKNRRHFRNWREKRLRRAGPGGLSDCLQRPSPMAMKRVIAAGQSTTMKPIEQRLSEVRKGTSRGRRVSKAIEKIAQQTNLLALYAMHRGLARRRGRVWLCGGGGRGRQSTFGRTGVATLRIRSTVDNLSLADHAD